MKRKNAKKTIDLNTVSRRDFDGEQRDPFPADPFAEPIADPLPADFATSPEWKHPEAEIECPTSHPFAARWQERSGVVYPSPVFTPDHCYEVTRWWCNVGESGIISNIGTALQAIDEETGDLNAPLLFFDPFALDRTAVPPRLHGIRFHLRMEPYKYSERGPLREVTSAETLPGTPHPELGTWHDPRYWWGCWWSRCRLLVPENHLVSLWWELSTFAELCRIIKGVAGLMRGNVWHYTRNDDATKAARRGID